MEMTIPQTASPSPAVSSAANASTQARPSSDRFQKTLEGQMKGDKGSAEKSGTTTASSSKADNQNQAASGTESAAKDASAVDQAAVAEAAAAAGSVTAEPEAPSDAKADLMEMIDQLLADLEEIKSDLADSSTDNQDQDMQELASMMDQLQALLALLGIPLPAQQQTQTTSSSTQDAAGEINGNQQLAAIVSKVQDSLLQLQSAMQEGTTKQIGQLEPVQLIGQQLQALQQFVQKHKDANARMEQPVVTAEQTPEITVTTTAPTVSVHLQRLSGKAVHPVNLAVSVNQQAPQEEAEAPTETSEQAPAVTTGQAFSDVIRQTAPQAAVKLAPTVQAYVPVTDFADNMKDFIQKLDIKHGSGMSEATIQLFPKELGQVDVRITMQNGQLTALFHADNAHAKDALDNQMAQLRVALQQQGLSVDKLEVTYGQSAAHLSNGQHGQGTGQQAFSNQNKSKGDGMQEDFESDDAEQQAIQDLGYGRAVNVTA
ncbi:flagellar hook-length control protein FliK [Paenibacillus glycanilyticus]|uniref:flagellar hook-length control protein FliK n=1 Tax=Paenibacillus glycanilyticus TaxID=126569 RepID=UPI00203CFB7F|nr:flagellar hook-length control protein FliK [Paenibacillus glycanilyticus]MCM3625947.1 flagellar hook-length control protein FliK [Paenibacillus glycanilyticus]